MLERTVFVYETSIDTFYSYLLPPGSTFLKNTYGDTHLVTGIGFKGLTVHIVKTKGFFCPYVRMSTHVFNNRAKNRTLKRNSFSLKGKDVCSSNGKKFLAFSIPQIHVFALF